MNIDKKTCIKASLPAALLLLVVGLGAAELPKTTQLSLQLKRDQESVPPQAEAAPPVDEFARFDRSIGGFGLVSGYFDVPIDITLNTDDEVMFVLDRGNSRVQRFDRNNSFLSQFGERGSREREFKDAQAIAIDKAGFIYVVDSGNHRIQKFEGDGDFVLEWGSLGSRTGLFNNPTDITFDDDNNAYVADPGNERIQKFTSNGRFLEEWNRFMIRGNVGYYFETIVSLAFDDDRFGYLLALSAERKTMQRFELDGDWVETLRIEPPGDCRPVRMEVDNDRDLVFIADDLGNRVLRYGKDGSYRGEVKEGAEEFSSPGGLFVDRKNRRLYVADTGNNLIQKFYLR